MLFGSSTLRKQFCEVLLYPATVHPPVCLSLLHISTQLIFEIFSVVWLAVTIVFWVNLVLTLRMVPLHKEMAKTKIIEVFVKFESVKRKAMLALGKIIWNREFSFFLLDVNCTNEKMPILKYAHSGTLPTPRTLIFWLIFCNSPRLMWNSSAALNYNERLVARCPCCQNLYGMRFSYWKISVSCLNFFKSE